MVRGRGVVVIYVMAVVDDTVVVIVNVRVGRNGGGRTVAGVSGRAWRDVVVIVNSKGRYGGGRAVAWQRGRDRVVVVGGTVGVGIVNIVVIVRRGRRQPLARFVCRIICDIDNGLGALHHLSGNCCAAFRRLNRCRWRWRRVVQMYCNVFATAIALFNRMVVVSYNIGAGVEEVKRVWISNRLNGKEAPTSTLTFAAFSTTSCIGSTRCGLPDAS